MLLRHITRCTSIRSPTKSGSPRRRPTTPTSLLSRGIGGTPRREASDQTPSVASSPMSSSQSNTLDRLLPRMASESDGTNSGSAALAPTMQMQIMVDHQGRQTLSVDQPPEHDMCADGTVTSGECSNDKLITTSVPTIVNNEHVMISMPTTRLEHCPVGSSVAPVEESVAARVERKLAAARQVSRPASEAFHCTVCDKLFPRTVSRFCLVLLLLRNWSASADTVRHAVCHFLT